MATFKEGIPDFKQDFCMMNGGQQSQIVGLYPLDKHRCYYFCGFAASKVRRLPMALKTFCPIIWVSSAKLRVCTPRTSTGATASLSLHFDR